MDSNVTPELIRDIKTPHAEFVPDEAILITSDNCFSVADRTLLAATSEYFRAKFKGPDGNDVAFKLDFVDAATLEVLLDFFYTGTIHINQRNVERIFLAANHFRFTQIMEGCADLFLTNLNTQSIWSCMKIGDAFNLPNMVNATHSFAIRNFPQFVQRIEFVQLEAKYLAAFLKDDNLCVENELDAFQAMTKWLMHSYTERLPFVPELLRTIRLTQLNVDFLTTNVAFLAKEANCLPLIDEALTWTRSYKSRQNPRSLSFNPLPRCSTMNMNFHIVCSGGSDNGDDPSKTFVELYKRNRSNGRHMHSLNAV